MKLHFDITVRAINSRAHIQSWYGTASSTDQTPPSALDDEDANTLRHHQSLRLFPRARHNPSGIRAGRRVRRVLLSLPGRRTGSHLFPHGKEISGCDRRWPQHVGAVDSKRRPRVPSLEALQQGRDFKIIELNRVTSEVTSIYDPKNSVFAAYRVLFAQWRIAFEIGRQNKIRGAMVTSPRELVRSVFALSRHC